MKRIFTILCCVAVALGLTGCYDDSKLWNKVDDLDGRLTALEKTVKAMNSDIESMNTIIATLQQGGVITEIVSTADGYEMTISGRTEPLVIKNGKDGQNGQTGANGQDAPVIGVKQDTDGVYYWTITTDGQTDWLTDGLNKLPVSGKDGASGVTPVMGVDSEGYWTVDYGSGPERIPGNIQATGNGDSSFFQNVTEQEGSVIFTLANGTQLTLPIDRAVLAFAVTAGGLPVALRYGAQTTVSLTLEGMQYAEVLAAPAGWSASLDYKAATVTISAPAAYSAGTALDGKVSVIGLSNNGQTLMAVQEVYVVDYTHPEGAFVVMEGNMSNQNGTLCYIDQYGRFYEHVYEEANDGRSPGNVLQDMWIAGDRIVLLNQNGNSMGGDGQIAVCDAHTMKLQNAYNDLNFNADHAKSSLGCPQHLAVIGDKAFIQYVDEAMEYNSGIKTFDLKSGTLSSQDIAGTFGTFAEQGALKGRMWASRGQIVAALANALVFIDPATEQIVKRVDFPNRQVKGVAKGADGNFHVVLSGEFTGSPNSAGAPAGAQITGIDHDGQTVYLCELPEDASFSVATWQPSVNLCASFKEPYLYLATGSDFSMLALDRFNYETHTLEGDYITFSGYDSIYGYPGVHPTTGSIYVGQSIAYMTTRISVFNPASLSEPVQVYDFNEASPAGVDFAYRFSETFMAL